MCDLVYLEIGGLLLEEHEEFFDGPANAHSSTNYGQVQRQRVERLHRHRLEAGNGPVVHAHRTPHTAHKQHPEAHTG